jgi:hypothetical protein
MILIHGQARTPRSMIPLGRRLQDLGHTIQYFRYATYRETFAEISGRLAGMIRTTAAGQPYVLVSHSLGGLLARAAMPMLSDMLPRHLIMLAPPNRPPLLAAWLQKNTLYRLATGDCGQRLSDMAFYQALPLPAVPTTIIAGTSGPRGRFSPFGAELNDGVISVAETRLGGSGERVLVPALHTFIMNSPEVADIICRVLADDK